MENNKRKLSDRPIRFGLVSMLLTDLCTYGLAYALLILIILLLRVTGVLGDIDLTAYVNQISDIIYAVVPFFAIGVMYLFYRRNQKNGYSGAIKIRGKNCRDVWICIGVFAVAFMARFFHGPLTIPNGFQQIHLRPFALLLSFCAGIAEEVVHRGIPVAVMMRGEPDSKRIRRVLIITSVLFSLMHLVNGYSAGNTIFQLGFTFVMGLFWGAIYLRTGSILITIVFHFTYDVLSDMLVLPDPIQAANLIFLFFVQALPIVLTVVLMRKSKMEEIKETWADIWNS